MIKKEERVELVGVPHYRQGDADELCGYYTMSMMLAALFPVRSSAIHGTPPHRWKSSLVFQGLRRLYRSDSRFKQKMADWFFKGMSILEATAILNQSGQQHDPSPGMHFLHWPARARRTARIKHSRNQKVLHETWSVNEVLYALSAHLPVIVAGGGIQGHAVLAIGYIAHGASNRWIYVLDPAAIHPEWLSSSTLFVDDAHIIVPNLGMFQEYRPARVVTRDGVTRFEQWSPNRGENRKSPNKAPAPGMTHLCRGQK